MRIHAMLRSDPAILAAWLLGSLAFGTSDAWSDLDLHVVVSDERYPDVVADRAALYSWAGDPVLVQELRVNTESAAQFNLVIYPGAVEVDWSLWPKALARRPGSSHLLFDRAGVPVDMPVVLSRDERQAEVAYELSFFWAMAVVGVKCIGRGYTTGAARQVELMIDAFDAL